MAVHEMAVREMTLLSAVVIDIEGTTSPAAHVTQELYPYARRRFASWLADHSGDQATVRAVEQVRELIGDAQASHERVVAALNSWLDDDLKITALKTIQGRIWETGFASGELVAPFFPDVIPALYAWHAAGLGLYVYSSGSVAAQQAWFGHTAEGDLRYLVSGNFDTENAGPKRVARSYRAIASAIGRPAGQIAFLSDLTEELDAARAAGWHTAGVRRPGEPYFDRGVGDHLEIASFAALDLTGSVPAARGAEGR